MTQNRKIYTKTGDQGKTRLVDGSCVEKFNPRVEAYGTVDELNSFLGQIVCQLKGIQILDELNKEIILTQNHLFRVGSLLACSDTELEKKLPSIEKSHAEFLENRIDQMTEELPELKNFILPGGHEVAAALHVARTLCRRAERRAAEVLNLTEESSNPVLIYLNRLSDYFFVAARWVNLKMGVQDQLWDKNK